MCRRERQIMTEREKGAGKEREKDALCWLPIRTEDLLSYVCVFNIMLQVS